MARIFHSRARLIQRLEELENERIFVLPAHRKKIDEAVRLLERGDDIPDDVLDDILDLLERYLP